MCGRFTVEIEAEELEKIIAAVEKSLWDHQLKLDGFTSEKKKPKVITNGLVLPSNVVAVKVAEGNRTVKVGKDFMKFMQWGFTEQYGNGTSFFNILARNETVHEKRTFKSLVNNRCLIPAKTYFESQEIKTEGRKSKIPYEFWLPGHQPIYMAAIWKEVPGSPIKKFVILTGEPREDIMQIHERMPIIIPQNLADVWLYEGFRAVSSAIIDVEYKKAV